MKLEETDHDVLRELKRGTAAEMMLRWVVEHTWVAPLLSLLYLLAIFGGRSWMRDRKPFKLRWCLVVWNASLALFNTITFIKIIPLMLTKWYQVGVVNSICSSLRHEDITFWLVLLVYSRTADYGDTIFIVLRKSPLIFLHWYHHVTVCLYAWYNARWGRVTDSVGFWLVCMNVFVHSIMYSYYMVKASGVVRVPKFVSQLVTTLQMCQFVIGLVCLLYGWWSHGQGYECYTSWGFVASGLFLYVSFLILFALFFYNRYLHKSIVPKPHSD